MFFHEAHWDCQFFLDLGNSSTSISTQHITQLSSADAVWSGVTELQKFKFPIILST